MEEENRRIQSESAEKVADAEKRSNDAIEALSDREDRVSSRENTVTIRERSLYNEVEALSEKKVSEEKKMLHDHYQKIEKNLSDKYKAMTIGYQTIFYAAVSYGIVATVLTAFQCVAFVWDFIAAICWIKNAAISFVGGVSVAATFVAGFGDKIRQPVVAVIVHWVLLILSGVVMVGGCGALLTIAAIKYVKFFKEKQADEFSLFVGLIVLALMVFVGDAIRDICPVNLFLMALLLLAGYSLIRGIIQMDNESVRNEIFKISGGIAGTIAFMAIMVHFFGGWAFIAVPVGILIAVADNR